MSDFKLGDVVLLSSCQVTVVTVQPGAPDLPRAIELPFPPEGATRTFAHEPDGETPEQIAAALRDVLAREQTHYAVEVDLDQVSIAGPPGFGFEVVLSAGLLQGNFSDAVAFRDPDGRLVGPIRVVEAGNRIGQQREFYTRDPLTGEVVRVDQVRGRELGTSNHYEFDAADVRIVLESAP